MAKILRSFRFKMIQSLGLSMLISGAISFLIYSLLQLFYQSFYRYVEPLLAVRQFIRKMGDINVFLIIFIPLAIFFFFLLTKRYTTYFEEISTGVNRLANGDFTSRVHITSDDEFGDIAKDINLAIKQLQYAMERGDFAESSKDQLVLNLAHDLRTPLTSVLGYLDFILNDDQLTREQVKHYSTIAFTKSQRLEKLVNELFEITRMSHGMLPLDKRQLNLSELLIQLNEEMYPALEKHHLTARLDVTADLPIYGDGDLLARVFENIMTNAIRYGSEGLYVDINAYTDGENVVIQLINYGDVIPPDMLPHLFDMFFTGDQSRTHQGGSTGLGLFIAKNIVAQHNGTITAESNLARTLFEVRLPLQQVPLAE
ncbi:ATP-binding protein [Brevibacillus sp. 179-C9.3 HS]|uniref:HAMP domain-containing sensor histidine kinase n=1 Tax=unclassified Brevibacillus TaxID=2684853 RepID=UPI0039A2F8EE